jgi:tetratricopeptide (TPR) repeat protein
MRVRPEDYQSPLLVAQIYEEKGSEEKARAARVRGIELARAHLLMNPDDARAVYMAANGMVALGQREMGVEWARRACQMRPDDSMLLYNVGCIYAMAGQTGEALDCLEKACALGLRQRGWYEHDSNLDSVRGEARFQALLRGL